MTNDHGSEPPHEEEAQPAQNPEAGAWTGDHPPTEAPTDDFSDPPAEEEAVTVSQETEAESEEASHAVPGRPRSLTWPFVAGIAGLVFLGGVVYWQFGRPSAPPVPPMVMMASQKPLQKGPAPMPAIPGSSSGSSANTAAELDALKPAPEPSYPDSAPTAPKTSMATAPEMPQPAATPSRSPTGVAMPMPTAAPPPPMPAPMAVPAAPAPAMAPGAGMADARIDALTARIDILEKSLNQATKQLNQVANMMAANQATPTVETRLNKIEQNLLELQHSQNTKMAMQPPAVSMPAPAAAPAMPMMEAAPVVAPAPIAPKIAAKPSTSAAAKKSTSTKTAVKKKAAPKAPPAPHWVLRAATPNEAWVSASATSSDLRHVQVGDILPGVGRIQAIRQTANGWALQGANGTVH